jgi:hypothetical protein
MTGAPQNASHFESAAQKQINQRGRKGSMITAGLSNSNQFNLLIHTFNKFEN